MKQKQQQQEDMIKQKQNEQEDMMKYKQNEQEDMMKQKQNEQEDMMKQKEKEQEQVETRSRDYGAGGAVTVRHNVYTSMEQHQSNYPLAMQVPFNQALHLVPQNRQNR